jgi:copper resistance protein D
VRAPQAYVPGEGVILPRNAEDIAWSEYNHYWAGILVLLIGLLAMVEHFRWGHGRGTGPFSFWAWPPYLSSAPTSRSGR